MRAWRFSSVGDGSSMPTSGAERRAVRVEDGGRSGSPRRRMPRRSRERPASRRLPSDEYGPGHRDAEDAVGAERLDGERRRDRRVDAAREAEDGAREAALAPRSRRGRARAPGAGRAIADSTLGDGPAPARDVDRPEVLLEAARRRRPGGRARRTRRRRRRRRGRRCRRRGCSSTSGTPRAARDLLHHAPAQAVLAERVGRGRDVDVQVEAAAASAPPPGRRRRAAASRTSCRSRCPRRS